MQIVCELKATMNEAHSLASQRGLSESSAGRLPLLFPVGQPVHVYFAQLANNIAGPYACICALAAKNIPFCLDSKTGTYC